MRTPLIIFSSLILATISVSPIITGEILAQPHNCGDCVDWLGPDCDKYRDHIWINACEASVTASWSGCSDPQRANSYTAVPPPGTAILNHRIKELSRNNGGHSVSTYAAGQSFSLSKEVTEAYENVLNLDKVQNDDKLKAAIKNEFKSALSEAEKFESSHQTLRVSVDAKPHGSCRNNASYVWHSQSRQTQFPMSFRLPCFFQFQEC